MLDSAVETLNAGERPVIHSDRGGHYRWPGWQERVNAAGLIRSMSRKGCSPDNAACEGFFGRLKTEMYYGHKWSGITPEKFMQQVDAYIRWYNERRIKLSLGAVSPQNVPSTMRAGIIKQSRKSFASPLLFISLALTKNRTARLWVYVRDDRNACSQMPRRSGSRTHRTGKVSIYKIIWPVTAVCFRPMLTVVTGRYTNPAE